MIADDDATLLRECLAWAAAQEELDDNQERWRGAFQSMLDRWRPLTSGQRSYVQGVHERLFIDAVIHYENAWSAGKVPRGTSLATPVPEVLLRPLPKRPPGRIG